MRSRKSNSGRRNKSVTGKVKNFEEGKTQNVIVNESKPKTNKTKK